MLRVDTNLAQPQSAPIDAALPSLLDSANHNFAPLPMRARGTLELIDMAIKVYKRYWRVLLAWSALVVLLGYNRCLPLYGKDVRGRGITDYHLVGWSFFLLPFVFGAGHTCLQAALHGRSARFSDCWRTSLAHYWKLLATSILGLIRGGIVATIVMAALVFVYILFDESELGNDAWMLITTIVLCLELGLVLAFVALWVGLAMTVAIAEPVTTVGDALGRSSALLRGRWTKCALFCWLFFGLGLAMPFVMLIMSSLSNWLAGGPYGQGSFTSHPVSQAVAFAFTVCLDAAFIMWLPFCLLALGLLYFDLRIRKEGFDIEWNAAMSDAENIGTPASAPAVSYD